MPRRRGLPQRERVAARGRARSCGHALAAATAARPGAARPGAARPGAAASIARRGASAAAAAAERPWCGAQHAPSLGVNHGARAMSGF